MIGNHTVNQRVEGETNVTGHHCDIGHIVRITLTARNPGTNNAI